MRANYNVPQSRQDLLCVKHPDKYMNTPGSFGVNENEWPHYVNSQSGWICIGDPTNNNEGIEFIKIV